MLNLYCITQKYTFQAEHRVLRFGMFLPDRIHLGGMSLLKSFDVAIVHGRDGVQFGG